MLLNLTYNLKYTYNIRGKIIIGDRVESTNNIKLYKKVEEVVSFVKKHAKKIILTSVIILAVEAVAIISLARTDRTNNDGFEIPDNNIPGVVEIVNGGNNPDIGISEISYSPSDVLVVPGTEMVLEPKAGSAHVTTLREGKNIAKFLLKDDDMVLVSSGNYVGYIPFNSLEPLSNEFDQELLPPTHEYVYFDEANNINVHNSPALSSDGVRNNIGQIPKNTYVKILACEARPDYTSEPFWSVVSFRDENGECHTGFVYDVEGYVDRNRAKFVSQEEIDAIVNKTHTYITITGNNINGRARPQTQEKNVIITLNNGDTAEVMSEDAEWYYVRKDKLYFYVNKRVPHTKRIVTYQQPKGLEGFDLSGKAQNKKSNR